MRRFKFRFTALVAIMVFISACSFSKVRHGKDGEPLPKLLSKTFDILDTSSLLVDMVVSASTDASRTGHLSKEGLDLVLVVERDFRRAHKDCKAFAYAWLGILQSGTDTRGVSIETIDALVALFGNVDTLMGLSSIEMDTTTVRSMFDILNIMKSIVLQDRGI